MNYTMKLNALEHKGVTNYNFYYILKERKKKTQIKLTVVAVVADLKVVGVVEIILQLCSTPTLLATPVPEKPATKRQNTT